MHNIRCGLLLLMCALCVCVCVRACVRACMSVDHNREPYKTAGPIENTVRDVNSTGLNNHVCVGPKSPSVT